MDEDYLLLRRMKKGEEEAIEVFVRKYYSDILKYSYRHLSDVGMAEDIAQETFEHFFRSLETYRHYGKAKNYLYVIAGNLCKNRYRSGKQNSEILADIDDNFLAGNLVKYQNIGNPDGHACGIDMKVDLQRSIERLPEELRTVLILYCFQELKLREIAFVLGISLPLVKYRLSQARKKMQAFMGEEDCHEQKEKKSEDL